MSQAVQPSLYDTIFQHRLQRRWHTSEQYLYLQSHYQEFTTRTGSYRIAEYEGANLQSKEHRIEMYNH